MFPDDYPALEGAESCQEDTNMLSMSLGEEDEDEEEHTEEAKDDTGGKDEDGDNKEEAAETEALSTREASVDAEEAGKDGNGRQQ